MTASDHLTQIDLGASPRAKHALIIEDDELIAASIEAELRDLGFGSFDVARSEAEAVMSAERRRPELITVDAKLEQGSGVEAAMKICSREAVPVIVITGNPFNVTLPGVVTLGKPFSSAAFRVALDQANARPLAVPQTSPGVPN